MKILEVLWFKSAEAVKFNLLETALPPLSGYFLNDSCTYSIVSTYNSYDGGYEREVCWFFLTEIFIPF